MKAYKVELLIVDFDGIGINVVTPLLESVRYPNHGLAPLVMSIQGRDIGEWRGDHPLNGLMTRRAEYERLFKGGD